MAWNMGTTAMMVCAALRPKHEGVHAPMACSTLERWLYSTPLGWPVVPLV